MESPTTAKAFHRLFPNEEACIEYLFHVRWPDGFVCPKCGGGPVGIQVSRALIRCKLNHQTSITAGTALHRSRVALWDWFYAVFIATTATPGISALQLQKQLGLPYNEAAFTLLHKMRSVLVDPNRSPLGGRGPDGPIEVQVNEGFIGGPEAGHPGRGAVDKAQIVLGIEVLYWTDEKGKQRRRAGRMRATVIPNAQAATLIPWIESNVAKGSHIVTDGLTSYHSLPRLGDTHATMIPRKGDPASYLPMPHLVISNLKAWLLGTFHGAVTPKHLQAYLNEYVFRFNRRFHRGPAFIRALRMLMGAKETVENEDIYQAGEPGQYAHPNPDPVRSAADALLRRASPALAVWLADHDADLFDLLEAARASAA